MAASITVSNLFPKAKKLEYDLKMLLDHIESGRLSHEESQRAMSTSNELAEVVSQLESLLNYEQASKRDMWRIKIRQLDEESRFLRQSLDKYMYRNTRAAREAQEREMLLSRRPGAQSGQGVAIEYYHSEADSIKRSSQMVGDLHSLGQTVLTSLHEQRSRLKSAHRKVIEIANTLGLSNSLLRVIERRDFVDKALVFFGMFVTLLFFWFAYRYSRG